MSHPVAHVEVIGQDAAKLQAYYAELFDWTITAGTQAGYGLVEGAGMAAGIGSAPTPDYAGHVTFYVEVPDVEGTLAKAADLGGTRVFGPAPVPGTEIVLGQFTDPEGHLIGVTQAF